MSTQPVGTLAIRIVLTLPEVTVSYDDYGIPEGDEGALMAAVSRELLGDSETAAYWIAEGEYTVSTTKAEDWQSSKISSPTRAEES